jgi:hypothetical protein
VIYAVAALIILAVAVTVAVPFWLPAKLPAGPVLDEETERLERDKAAALLAIREAQLDRAMGKLSDEDYAALRGFYERRAMSAMEKLGNGKRTATRGVVERCSECDARFTDDSQTCARCGAKRHAAML